jgi:hypothetical protein
MADKMDDRQVASEINKFMKENILAIKDVLLTYLEKLSREQYIGESAKQFLIALWCH